MKKTIVIVVVIAVVILGGFILLSKSQPNLENQISNSKSKAAEASLKAFVATAMADIARYYSDEKNTAAYDQNAAKKTLLDDKFAAIKNKYPGDYAYKIYDENESAAVKAAETSAGIYVCIDSLNVQSVNISASEFDKKTDCSGQPLK